MILPITFLPTDVILIFLVEKYFTTKYLPRRFSISCMNWYLPYYLLITDILSYYIIIFYTILIFIDIFIILYFTILMQYINLFCTKLYIPTLNPLATEFRLNINNVPLINQYPYKSAKLTLSLDFFYYTFLI